MAKLLQAVNKYGPKIELKNTAGLDRLADWMVMRTTLTKSEVMLMFQEMGECILYFNMEGTPVKISGVGTFTPLIDRDGVFKVSFRADMDLKNGMNTPDKFGGVLANKTNIGITNEQLKELWDAEHPGDPLEI